MCSAGTNVLLAPPSEPEWVALLLRADLEANLTVRAP